MSVSQADVESSAKIRHVPLSFHSAELQTSALRLILSLFPDWEQTEGKVEFVRFTDGITNTLLKAVKRRPGYSEEQIDKEAVLLRAYGTGTEVLIDRERETTSHSLLSQHGLAPPLLARFQNGLLYRFIRGRVCTPEDLRREEVWQGVARRLGEWHGRLPIVTDNEDLITSTDEPDAKEPLTLSPTKPGLSQAAIKAINAISPGKGTPNLWTVMQKWIFALPVRTDAEKTRKAVLQKELERIVAEFGDSPTLGKDGFVFGHCDLLSGNVIIHPQNPTSPGTTTVSFIDYEYATPCPAAFDLANHFSEWGGFSCDSSVLPTRSIRRAFLQEYLHSYTYHSHAPSCNGYVTSDPLEKHQPNLEKKLFAEVDRFRGIPGFYWGVWALIQKTISQIDFDYGGYAELRLGEYWAWRKVQEGGEKSVRERRWEQE